MKGKYISIPFGMVFKNHYCSKCGTKLNKEKTHRIVTKDDLDYYQYHEYGTFPRHDYDIYEYRFSCPCCGARISFDEQCIIKIIQKKCKKKVLSLDEIKENYKSGRKTNNTRVLVRNILIPLAFCGIFFPLFYLFATDRTTADLAKVAIMFGICAVCTVFGVLRGYRGKGKRKINRSYSHEKESQLKRLHAYSSHNSDLVIRSDKCYCFYCRSAFGSHEVDRYIDNGNTALCPKCNIDAVIPDGIDEEIDDKIISEMHDYWF